MSTNEKTENPADVRTYVRERYGKIAQDFAPETAASCCGPEGGDRSLLWTRSVRHRDLSRPTLRDGCQ